ncbi:MAG: HAD hydrolase family protein [Candidatus Omnitrophica bacterium]|nr:HAD hydrolase family protein [Candidatus Omnitrophota bacterium]
MMSVARKAAHIRALVLDVDGVLTDGSLTYAARSEQRTFHVQDGLGIVLWQQAGYRCALLTSKASAAVRRRAQHLHITDVFQNIREKLPVFHDFLKKYRLQPAEVCYMGDDLLDLAVLQTAGLAITVPAAGAEVKAAADYVTQRGGGQGAAREAVELILKAQNRWTECIRRYASPVRELRP